MSQFMQDDNEKQRTRIKWYFVGLLAVAGLVVLMTAVGRPSKSRSLATSIRNSARGDSTIPTNYGGPEINLGGGFFEGDIKPSPREIVGAYGPQQATQILNKLGINITLEEAKGLVVESDDLMRDKTFRWPNGTVYWTILPAINPIMLRSAAVQAINEIENNVPGLRFFFLDFFDFLSSGQKSGLLFFDRLPGCYTQVGHQAIPTIVNLGQGCLRNGIVLHEILHTLGFWHEQSRPDRDRFVKILYENILPGREIQFLKRLPKEVNYYGSHYDYRSIMHYSAYAFSKNDQKTIIQTPGNPPISIGNRDHLSSEDIRQLNFAYPWRRVTGGRYQIVNKRSNKSLDVDQEHLPKEGMPVGQYSLKEAGNRRWVLRDAGEGYVFVECENTGLNLGIDGVLKGAGARLVDGRSLRSENQKFGVERQRDGQYIIRSVHSGMLLTVDERDEREVPDGAHVFQYPQIRHPDTTSQRFRLIPR